ncbi:thioesterase domain-containing protein [Microcoleus sp. B5-D4]|uniref:thioesterase domain-containing protein n=1 Tax=unclassified Microcoleus TaxID=2642155 RepID=UPI002FD63DAA
MSAKNYTETEIEQLLKDYIIQRFMYGAKAVLEDDWLLIEEGIINSLGIITLISFIGEQLGISIASEEIVLDNFKDVNSVKSLVISKIKASTQPAIIQEGTERKLLSVVPVKPNGYKRPFFYIHGMPGYNPEVNLALAQHIDPNRPFYGIQAMGVNEGREPHTSLEKITTFYIQEIQTIQPEGPYLLGGVCAGGNIAFEMAQQLKKCGQQVLLVVMVDSPNPFITVEEKTNLPNWYPKPHLREKLLNKGLNINQFESIFRVWEANVQVIANHVPQVYADRIVYFAAMEKVMEKHRFEPMQPNGWNSFVVGGIELHEVPGSHLTMHFEPHVQVLAEKLSACLDQADRELDRRNDETTKCPLSSKNPYSNAQSRTVATLTLVELLQNRASRQPAQIAYTFLEDGEKESASLTYRQLDEKARAIAAYLQSRLSPGERVLLVYPQGWESIAAFFGCLYAGVVAIPAPAPEASRMKRTLPRLEAIASDAGASLILTTASLLAIRDGNHLTFKARSFVSRLNGRASLLLNYYLAEGEIAQKTPQLATIPWTATEKIPVHLATQWRSPEISGDTNSSDNLELDEVISSIRNAAAASFELPVRLVAGGIELHEVLGTHLTILL